MLHVQDANKSYGSESKTKHVLRDLCISVEEHTIYGILGASGCGKTTILTTELNDCVLSVKWERLALAHNRPKYCASREPNPICECAGPVRSGTKAAMLSSKSYFLYVDAILKISLQNSNPFFS